MILLSAAVSTVDAASAGGCCSCRQLLRLLTAAAPMAVAPVWLAAPGAKVAASPPTIAGPSPSFLPSPPFLLLAQSLLLLLAVHFCFFEAPVVSLDVAAPPTLHKILSSSSPPVVSKHSPAHVPLPRTPCTSEGGGQQEGRGQLGQTVVVYL
jgi:hypothetical protein